MKRLLTALLFLGLALSTQAQSIGVQFWTSGEPNNAPLGASQTAGVVPQDNFNALDINLLDTATFPLVDSTGASTAATLTLGNSSDGYFTGTSTSTANGTLLSGQSGDYSRSPATYTFNGLLPGTYDLIVYTVTNVTGQNARFDLVNGTTSGPTSYFDVEQNGADFNGTFTPSSATSQGAATTANYIEFAEVSPDAGTIEISLPDQGVTPYVDAVNGLQLIELPEPSSVFLAAIAALAMLGMAWKFRTAARC